MSKIGDLVLLHHVHEYHEQVGSGEDARMVRKTRVLSTKAAIVTGVDDQGAVAVHVFKPDFEGMTVQDSVGDDSGYIVCPVASGEATTARKTATAKADAKTAADAATG